MDTTYSTDISSQPTSNSKGIQAEEQCEEDVPNGKKQEVIEEVVFGKEFIDVQSAHKFYTNYGGTHGFNVRVRNSRKNIEEFVTWVKYCCSREGFKEEDKRRTNISYSQPETRCGCQAHLTILLQKNGNFKVVSFEKDHNHPLVKTPMKHMLKVNRKMSGPQKAHADDGEFAGISIKGTVAMMSKEVGGPENKKGVKYQMKAKELPQEGKYQWRKLETLVAFNHLLQHRCRVCLNCNMMILLWEIWMEPLGKKIFHSLNYFKSHEHN